MRTTHKCERCRQVKKACVFLGPWPEHKCENCKKGSHPCSEPRLFSSNAAARGANAQEPLQQQQQHAEIAPSAHPMPAAMQDGGPQYGSVEALEALATAGTESQPPVPSDRGGERTQDILEGSALPSNSSTVGFTQHDSSGPAAAATRPEELWPQLPLVQQQGQLGGVDDSTSWANLFELFLRSNPLGHQYWEEPSAGWRGGYDGHEGER